MNLNPETAQYIQMIIPTVLIPFTLVSVGLSVVATFIAGLFGIKLKAEGPKQLLEVLLRPKVLIAAVIMNILFYAGYEGYLYVKNLPAFEMTIAKKHQVTASNKIYSDHFFRSNNSTSTKNKIPKKLTPILSWERKLPKGAFRAGVLNADSIFFGVDDGYVYELESATGKTLRRFFIGTMVSPAPIFYQGKLYTGEGSHDTHHARVYQIDLASGEHGISYTTKGHTEGQPIIAVDQGKEFILAVAGTDGLHAIDLKTMKKVWHKKPGHIDATVRAEGSTVYVGTGREKGDSKKYRTYALAYDLHSGKELWKNELPMSSWMEPVITNKYACFIMGEIYFKTQMGGLACFDKKTGAPEFSILNNAPLIGIPFVLDDDVIISDLTGKLCRISTMTRKINWCFNSKAKGKQMTSVSYDPRTNLLVYTTAKKGIYFLNSDSGKKVFHFMPDKKIWQKAYASATITPDGIIIVDIEGNILKYRLDIN